MREKIRKNFHTSLSMPNTKILNPSATLRKIDTLVLEPTITTPPVVQAVESKEIIISKISFFSKILNTCSWKPKVIRPNQINDVSDKGLRDLIESHKDAIVPPEYIGTLNEDNYKVFFFNYCVQFRDALSSKDIFLFHELFLNSLGNEHLYAVSGYPFNVLSQVFSLVVQNQPYEYAAIPEFSASHLSSLVKTKTEVIVDLDTIATKPTDINSFKQAYEIVIAKARLCELKDPGCFFVMTDDSPKKVVADLENKGYKIESISAQKNHNDSFLVNFLRKIATSVDMKIAGRISAANNKTFNKRSNDIVYIGPLTPEQRRILKSQHCSALKKNLSDIIANRSISERDRSRYLKIKHYVIGYENAANKDQEDFFFNKLIDENYPIKSFIDNSNLQ